MSCPPNIWAGLYDKYLACRDLHRSQGATDDEASRAGRQHVIELFGGRITAVATGGAPTPRLHLEFAAEVCS